MAAYDPEITVEFAFGSGPLETITAGGEAMWELEANTDLWQLEANTDLWLTEASGAGSGWTDVSAYVQSVRTRRGRASEFEQFTAGSATVVLKDTTRMFDPLNTAGPYYGELLPNVPVRITATYSSTDYRRFYGFVDGWDVNLDRSNRVAFVSVQATDGFKILAQKRLPDPLQTEIDTINPIARWRIGTQVGSSLPDDIGERVLVSPPPPTAATGTGSTVGPGGWVAVDGLNAQSTGAVEFGAYTAAAFVSKVSAYAPLLASDTIFTGTAWTFSMWLRCTGGPGGTAGVVRHSFLYVDAYDGAQQIIVLRVDEYGIAEFFVNAGGTTLSAQSTVNICDNNPHHIVGVRDGTTINLYIDGALAATDTDGGATDSFATFGSGSIFHLGLGDESAISVYPAWQMDDFFVAQSTLSAASVANLYDAYANLYGGTVLTGERVGDVLTLAGWPVALRDIDGGETFVGPSDIAGDVTLAYLQLVAASEPGRFFMGQDGNAVYHDGLTISANTAAAATFTDDGTDNKYLAGSLRFTIDDHNIFNEAQVTREGGAMQTATDATSVTAYGPRTWSASGLPVASDGVALNLAERKVVRYKDPQTRADSWTVNPQRVPSTWGTILGLEIGDHVELEVRPVGTGTRATVQLDLEQIVETITPDKYELTFFGSPRDPNIGAYLEWGGADGAVTGWGVGKWR
jgi:hypothetical protein